MFKRVRVAVANRSKGAQTPWESSSLTGDLVVNVTVNVVAPAGPPTPSTARFDGLWTVTIACSKVPTGAEGYVLRFFVEVKDGVLRGQHGTDGQPNSLTLTGQIQPDGSAAISARGLTGEPKYSVNREGKGTPYGYRATARFESTRGTGKKTDIRPCDLTFAKQ